MFYSHFYCSHYAGVFLIGAQVTLKSSSIRREYILYSHHLSARQCNGIVRRNENLITYVRSSIFDCR